MNCWEFILETGVEISVCLYVHFCCASTFQIWWGSQLLLCTRDFKVPPSMRLICRRNLQTCVMALTLAPVQTAQIITFHMSSDFIKVENTQLTIYGRPSTQVIWKGRHAIILDICRASEWVSDILKLKLSHQDENVRLQQLDVEHYEAFWSAPMKQQTFLHVLWLIILNFNTLSVKEILFNWLINEKLCT
jgi:ABC-type uncharacterized transport system YnjBCD substrate-binding protein